MRVWALAGAMVLGLAATSSAGPLDLKQVCAEAKWIVHFDVDAMRQSTLVQRTYDKCVDGMPSAEQRLREVTDLVDHLGIDVTKDLHGLTAYGTKVGDLDGVFLVDANVDQKMLLEKADQAPDHKTTPHGDHVIHSWIDAQGRQHEHPMSGTIYKANTLIFAPTVELVGKALDVLDGKSPGVAGKPGPLAAKIPDGTLIVVRAAGLADAKLPWKSPLLTQSEVFGVTIGERDGKVSFDGTLIAKSKETADKAKAVVEGARAMAELHHGQEAEAMKLIKALKTTVADKTLSVEFSAPVDEFWTQAEKAVQKAIEHHKSRAENKSSQ
jgi:hypothetical protein